MKAGPSDLDVAGGALAEGAGKQVAVAVGGIELKCHFVVPDEVIC